MTSNILTSNCFPHTHSINLLLNYSIAQKISDTRYFYDTKKISRSQTGNSNKDFFIFYFVNNHPNVLLSHSMDYDNYKLYLSDTGLFITLMFIDKISTTNEIYAKLLSDKMPANLGYLYENLIAQMITATGRQLFYHTWEKKGSTHYYEVDFFHFKGNKN